jgi:SAM-dependent methyltransferase
VGEQALAGLNSSPPLCYSFGLMVSVADYHEQELAIARDPTNPAFCLPTLPLNYQRVLDVGCGYGQTLEALGVPAEKGFGVDIETKTGTGYDLRPASAERLPFPDSYFDVVICRVTLPYTDVPKALSEIARVLTPGGRVWFLLHGWPSLRRRGRTAIQRGDLKDLAFLSYVALNSIVLHCFGRTIAWRLPTRFNGHRESVQTIRGMQQSLRNAGLKPLTFVQEHFFYCWAEKFSRTT